MNVTELHLPKHSIPQSKTYKNPYYKLEIIQIDHSQIYYQHIADWGRDHTCEVKDYKGFRIIGLPFTSTESVVELTSSITIEETGEYWVHVVGDKGPWNPGNTFTLEIDSKNISTSQNMDSPWPHMRWYDLGYHQLTSGTKNLRITLDYGSWVSEIYLYKINRYVGEKTKTNSSDNHINIKNIEFTENTIGELNTCKITIDNKPEYLCPEYGWTGYVFNDWDVVTLYIGASADESRIKFGGYITDCIPSSDNNTLNLNCVDRLRDLMRQRAYTNFEINVNARSDEKSEFPHISFSSPLETIRYLAETQEIPIKTDKIEYPYGLNVNLGVIQDYDEVTVDGFVKKHDKRAGNPPPCMKLSLDKMHINNCGGSSEEIECVIFDESSNAWDAAQYKLLTLQYMAPSCSTSATTMLQFNIGVTMYKTGESPANAVEYNIGFTGKSNAPNLIGFIKPILNGKWQTPKFDLKAAFDKYAYSSNYYVTKIRLWDNVTSSQVASRDKQGMYIDNVYSYDESITTKLHQDMGENTPYENLKKIVDEIQYVAYVEYASERRNDILVVTPQNNEICPLTADEGVNIRKITLNSTNTVKGVSNRVTMSYQYTRDGVEYSGKSYYINKDAYIHQRGPLDYYEHLSDVESQIDSDKHASRYINNNSYPKRPFSIEIEGTSLLNPSQTIPVTYLNYGINSDQTIKTIKHSLNIEKNDYSTHIDFGEPGDVFWDEIADLYNQMKNTSNRETKTMYDHSSLIKRGRSGLGTFISS